MAKSARHSGVLWSKGPTPFARPQTYVRAIIRTLRKRKALALPALFVWVFSTVAIIVAVVISARSAEQAERDKASLLVSSVATGFKAALERALFPLVTIATAIQESDGSQKHSDVQRFFTRAAPTLLQVSPAANDIQIAPYGVISLIYPIITNRRNATQILVLGGHDLFDAKSPVANRRDGAIQTLVRAATTNRPYVVEGPLSLLLPPTVSQDGGCVGCVSDPWARLALIARACIFSRSTDAEDTWADTDWQGVSPDSKRLGPFRGVTDCPRLPFPRNDSTYCDVGVLEGPLAGRKFWGIANAVIMWTSLLNTAGVTTLLGDSSGDPYMWSISRSPLYWDGVSQYTPLQISANVKPLDGTSSDSISTTVRTLDGSEWTIVIARSTWGPAWEIPVVIVAVFAALVLSACVLLLWVEHAQNTDLLLSVLPARVVASGDVFGFSEIHEHVTMLFSDIVSYTTMTESSQPLEIMKLVAGLFSHFDKAADKHKVYKVETIGDAYFCCAGAPDPFDPVEQALRIVDMALDMIEITRRFRRTHDGQELEIRIGLHCGGPVCAGVVGSKMPHWSLFGDTVNTTSRMESNSVAGRIHISDPLAQILKEALDSGRASHFNLQERGRIWVKGKGNLFTWWLFDQRAHRPIPSTEPRLSGTSFVSNDWYPSGDDGAASAGASGGAGGSMRQSLNAAAPSIGTQTHEPGGMISPAVSGEGWGSLHLAMGERAPATPDSPSRDADGDCASRMRSVAEDSPQAEDSVRRAAELFVEAGQQEETA